MTSRFILLYFVAILFFQIQSLASGEHSEEGHDKHADRIGMEKALQKVDSQKGFKISSEAIKSLNIRTEPLDLKKLVIPKTSLVSIQDKKGIYILREGFFQFIEISSPMKLKPGDQIVVKGMGIIAITDVYSTDESEYSH